MAHSSKERELESFTLMLRQNIQPPVQKMSQIGARNIVTEGVTLLRDARLFLNRLEWTGVDELKKNIESLLCC